MNEEIPAFQELVLSWARQEGRHFPWRQAGESKYRLVITELLLQRTKAETVRNNYKIFFSQYPNWDSLAQASESAIGDVLKPLGLWQRRAPVFKQLATIMVARKGRFPLNRKEIDSLPGVGQYIGNAIELLCHRRPRPLLDSSMARVLERYFGPRKLADIRHDPYLQSLSHQVVDHDLPREMNWAILDLGATICKVKKPLCGQCMLRIKCLIGREYTNESNNDIS